ncbi:cytochrome biogenesis protein [Herminiimonas sp. KBW02]|uniref:sulfite exporter TauE/SafE family protein n=1 Tax=Herminiimonas sp. KBW02 TaxID=2153363 RepID=UPI000F5B5189|nr:sulfite exporter TauE/SafE family protein [Herminiimonas sp. KBW02]RQO36378.1 cytochrome biogenesis protein [Herminiimonas sp. KBW02]
MSSVALIPIFMLGLLGSLHCIGMCGGIVSAFSAASGPRRPFPAVVVTIPTVRHQALTDATQVLAYNAGRIGSYAVAGAIVGGLAGGVHSLTNIAALQVGGYWLANLMLVALGLYLMDVWRGLARLEAWGQVLWSRLRPLMQPLLPMDKVGKAFALGGIWGWLPCGMVYSVLLTAMFSGSALSGASVMLAFGLGTLPALLGLGMLGSRLRELAQQRSVRIACGLIVLAFGVLGLLRAGGVVANGWLDILCLTPQTGGH